jgi:hypothetical protein
VGKRLLYFFQKRPDRLWGTPSIYRTVNQLEREVYHSPPSSVEQYSYSVQRLRSDEAVKFTLSAAAGVGRLRGAVRGSLNVHNDNCGSFRSRFRSYESDFANNYKKNPNYRFESLQYEPYLAWKLK